MTNREVDIWVARLTREARWEFSWAMLWVIYRDFEPVAISLHKHPELSDAGGGGVKLLCQQIICAPFRQLLTKVELMGAEAQINSADPYEDLMAAFGGGMVAAFGARGNSRMEQIPAAERRRLEVGNKPGRVEFGHAVAMLWKDPDTLERFNEAWTFLEFDRDDLLKKFPPIDGPSTDRAATRNEVIDDRVEKAVPASARPAGVAPPAGDDSISTWLTRLNDLNHVARTLGTGTERALWTKLAEVAQPRDWTSESIRLAAKALIAKRTLAPLVSRGAASG